MKLAEKLLIVAGVGVATYWLLRPGRPDMGVLHRSARGMFSGLDALNRMLQDDMPLFADGAGGAFANVGGLSGTPYTLIDGEGYYLTSGR